MLLTMREIGLAISFSLSQMGIIISTLGGIFLLGERKSKRNVLCYFWLHFVILGGILLVYESVNSLFTLIFYGVNTCLFSEKNHCACQ